MSRQAAHLNAEIPLLRAICLVVRSLRSNNHLARSRVHGAVAHFPRRPDSNVLSKSIPLFFIGRNRSGLWVAREAEGRAGGLFLLKQSALRFAQKHSAPVGCATMFIEGSIELDIENSGNPSVQWIDAVLGRIKELIPACAPANPISETHQKGDRP